MSLSKKEKKILNNAISDYQTAVLEREAEEWARQEAERRKEADKSTTEGCFLLFVIVVVIFIILYLLGLREWIENIISFFVGLCVILALLK